ncbi:MAG TPA: protein kinase, partial [Polyangiaceae bacterium]
MLAVGNGSVCQEWDYGTLSGYAPEALIGKGAFGSVFRATQSSTGQTVAVKVLHRGVDADPEVVQRNAARFQREARLLGRLRHPNIVSLLDTVETESGQLCAIF